MSGGARPLLAFAGPSISRAEVTALCPALEVRRPIRRGDLYREREQGAWGFLIIDGVFMQEDAVSPREVVDVLEDGAFVVGAASMGALRAADCWPAGARGVGLIYRLYRRGLLESDEEVAVAVAADGSDAPVSLPLVNVRYAMARAVRRRLVDRAEARRIVSVAASIYYPERTWAEVLRRAGHLTSELAGYCATLDLKREDARRAVRWVAARLREAPGLPGLHARRGDAPFPRSEATRERGYDASAGLDPDRLPALLAEWLVGSGRITRHLPRLSLPLEVATADPGAFARATWAALAEAGELDAELMRLQAVLRAGRAAEDAGLRVRVRDVLRARYAILRYHGFPTWRSLQASSRGRQFRAQIAGAEARLARAKRMREVWFARSSTPSGPADGHRGGGGAWQRVRALLARAGREALDTVRRGGSTRN